MIMDYNDIAPGVRMGRNSTIRKFNYIGRNVKIGDRTKIANHCDINSGCIIGHNCNIQTHVVLSSDTKVGHNCWFAGGVLVADEKFPAIGRQVRKPTVFGNNVIVGMGALIIGGITVGDNAVIAMGAVVTKDIPEDEVWVGNPAKPVIKKDGTKMTRADYDAKKEEWENEVVKES